MPVARQRADGHLGEHLEELCGGCWTISAAEARRCDNAIMYVHIGNGAWGQPAGMDIRAAVLVFVSCYRVGRARGLWAAFVCYGVELPYLLGH